MTESKKGLIQSGSREKKSVQELLDMRKEHENLTGADEHGFQDALQEEFHTIWEDTIKPALEQLKETTEEVLERFSEFEDDFRGYLRDKEPDVDVALLEEIYGETLRARAEKKNKPDNTDTDV